MSSETKQSTKVFLLWLQQYLCIDKLKKKMEK